MLPQILATFWKAKKQTLWFKLRLCHRKTFLLVNFFAITYFRFYFIFYVKIAPQSPPYPTSLFPTNPPLKKILPSPPPLPPLFEDLARGSTPPPSGKGENRCTLCPRYLPNTIYVKLKEYILTNISIFSRTSDATKLNTLPMIPKNL